MRVAVPRVGDDVAPRFEYSRTVSIYDVDDEIPVHDLDFPFHTDNCLDRVRLLRDQKIDLLICSGIEAQFETMINARGTRVISWVSGNVTDLLNLLIRGDLAAGSPTQNRDKSVIDA